MSITESMIRRIIREELLEGILDATSGTGNVTPASSDTRAATRAKDLANAKKTADVAAKRLTPAIASKKPEVSKMSVPDLKGWVKGYGKDDGKERKVTDPEEMKKAAAAVLNLSKRDPQGSKEMLSNMKDNPQLRGAVLATPGMTDMQSAADMKLRASGRDPKTAVGDSWREIGNLSSKYNLAESDIRRIIKEELLRESSGSQDINFDDLGTLMLYVMMEEYKNPNEVWHRVSKIQDSVRHFRSLQDSGKLIDFDPQFFEVAEGITKALGRAGRSGLSKNLHSESLSEHLIDVLGLSDEEGERLDSHLRNETLKRHPSYERVDNIATSLNTLYFHRVAYISRADTTGRPLGPATSRLVQQCMSLDSGDLSQSAELVRAFSTLHKTVDGEIYEYRDAILDNIMSGDDGIMQAAFLVDTMGFT